jgi:3-oxoacyl-[acyl-carrier-protein] synthase-3
MNLEESKVLMNIESMEILPPTLPLVLYDFEHLFKKRTIILAALEEVSRGFCLFKMGVRKK